MRNTIVLFLCVLMTGLVATAQQNRLEIAPDALETLVQEKPSTDGNERIETVSFYQEMNPFQKIAETKNGMANLKASVALSVQPEEVQAMYDANEEFMSIEIPAFNDESYIIELNRKELLTDDFSVVTSESNGQPVDVTPGHHYSGVIKGDPHSTVSFSVFEDEMIGMISIGGDNIVIVPNDERKSEYILYNDQDVAVDLPFSCESLTHPEMEASPYVGDDHIEASNCVRVYIECDYALHNNKGGTAGTVNWITAVYNNVTTLYSNENISTTISQIFVWTSPDGYSTSSSYSALTQFRSRRPSYNGDLAHLAALGASGLGGIAWLDALCSSYGYAYSNINSGYATVPSYSWTVEVMTHEMGHNLGSNHTQWCGWPGGAIDNCYTPEGGCSRGPAPTNGGTIMSYCHLTAYGINFNNGFGPLPGDKIRAEVAAAGCLTAACGGGGCGVPSGLSISSVTSTSAIASWNSVSGANSYDISYKLSTSGTWTNINTTGTAYTLSGLASSSTYNVRVRAICSGGSSSWSGTVNFTTLAGSCGVPSGLSISGITTSTANASWNSVSGANSYQLQYRESPSGAWSQISTGGTFVTISGLNASTSYDVRVRAVCSGGASAWSGISTFTTTGGGGGGGYCASSGNSCSQEWIRRVRVSGFDRSSGCDNGYYDGTHLTGNITKGYYNLIYFQAGKSGSYRRFYWRVWVDLNQNGSFDDPGELRVSGYSNSTNLLYAYMYIPSSALNGQTRMRVSMRYGGYPGSCGDFSRGEVEDYTLEINGAGSLEVAPVEKESMADVTLAPNPSSDYSRLEFKSSHAGQIDLTLVDLTGKPIRSWQYDAVEGYNFVDVEMAGLPQGNYLLRVDDGNDVKILKLLKI